MTPEFTFVRKGGVVVSEMKLNGDGQERHFDPCAEYRRMVETFKAREAHILEKTAKG